MLGRTVSLFASLSLALGLFTSVARADDGSYAQAVQQFKDGQYATALELIDKGLASDAKNQNLLRLRGEVMLAKRDFEGALSAYEAFIAAGARGANRRKAKKIVDNLASVRTTFLHVKIENGPAQVYVDSKSLGVYCVAEPECKKGLMPGRYRLFVEREGFHPLVERVDIAIGQTTTVERKLSEMPSPLTVDVVPAEAQITLDGQPIPTGAQPQPIAAGEHELAVALPGFAAHTQNIEAHAGQPVAVSVRLAELVPITVTAPGAALLLDGKPVQLQGGALALPSDGAEHTLTARADGYKEATVAISATRQRGTPVEIQLEKTVPDKQPPKKKPAPPPARDTGMSRGRLAAGLALATVAVGSFGGAGIFALEAQSRWDSSMTDCDEMVRCNDEGFLRVTQAQDAARVADILVLIGTGAGVASLIVLLTGGGDEAPSRPAVSVGSSADGTGVGVSIGGGF